jgi:hypothetical protein
MRIPIAMIAAHNSQFAIHRAHGSAKRDLGSLEGYQNEENLL